MQTTQQVLNRGTLGASGIIGDLNVLMRSGAEGVYAADHRGSGTEAMRDNELDSPPVIIARTDG
jgi:hypothetical protein